MDHIGKFLDGILDKKDLSQGVDAARAVDLFSEVAVEYFGPVLVRSIAHVVYRDRMLVIHVLNSVVMQEMQMKKIPLLSFLKGELGDDLDDVMFMIGAVDERA